MKGRMKAIGIGLACLACCLPLILAVTGATTGVTGAVGYWLGRNEALLVAGLGLAYLAVVVIRHTRARLQGRDRLPMPQWKGPGDTTSTS